MSKKYLFFDLEYASCKNGYKICEFGYVITNDAFKILARENLIINPSIPRKDWDYYALDNILTRTISNYESKQKFPHFYARIYHLISSVDIVVGHTLNGDAKALNDECKRYNLPLQIAMYMLHMIQPIVMA